MRKINKASPPMRSSALLLWSSGRASNNHGHLKQRVLTYLTQVLLLDPSTSVHEVVENVAADLHDPVHRQMSSTSKGSELSAVDHIYREAHCCISLIPKGTYMSTPVLLTGTSFQSHQKLNWLGTSLDRRTQIINRLKRRGTSASGQDQMLVEVGAFAWPAYPAVSFLRNTGSTDAFCLALDLSRISEPEQYAGHQRVDSYRVACGTPGRIV